MTKKIAVITHGHCLDGFTAAYYAQLQASDEVEILHWFWEHGKNPPRFKGRFANGGFLSSDPSETTPGKLVKYGLNFVEEKVDDHIDLGIVDEVLFADIFPTLEMLEFLDAEGAQNKVVILDHHAGAKNVPKDAPEGTPSQFQLAEDLGFDIVFSDHHSGAFLMWRWFNSEDADIEPQPGVPLLVKLVEDGDLWKFEVPGTKEVRVLMETMAKDMASWARLDEELTNRPEEFIASGKAAMDYRDLMVEKLCQKANWVYFDEKKIPMVNCPVWQSEIGNRLCRMYPEAPFALVYFVDGMSASISLRSDNKEAVNVIAQKFGGNGHPNAAGCRIAMDEFVAEVLATKTTRQ